MPAMESQVRFDKARDKEVAVIVALPEIQLQWIITDSGRGLKRLWLKLFSQEIIRIALIDQGWYELPCLAHQ